MPLIAASTRSASVITDLCLHARNVVASQIGGNGAGVDGDGERNGADHY